MSCTKVSLLSRYGTRDDRRVFVISPEMENKLSTGTDDALGVRNIRAIRLRCGCGIVSKSLVTVKLHRYEPTKQRYSPVSLIMRPIICAD